MDAEEFEGLIEGLGNDLTVAAVHLRLYRDLRLSVTDYKREINEAQTFWSLTLNAHLQNALHALARAYDQEPSSLSLRRWLETIEANLHLFAVESFRERLRDNPFVESLADHPRTPDVEQLARDLEYCSNSNPLVRRLTIIRNNALAHRGARHAARGESPFEQFPLSFIELDELVEGAYRVYNTYNRLFRATTLSPQMLGHADYIQVLKAVQRDLRQREREWQTQIDSDQSGRVT